MPKIVSNRSSSCSYRRLQGRPTSTLLPTATLTTEGISNSPTDSSPTATPRHEDWSKSSWRTTRGRSRHFLASPIRSSRRHATNNQSEVKPSFRATQTRHAPGSLAWGVPVHQRRTDLEQLDPGWVCCPRDRPISISGSKTTVLAHGSLWLMAL